MEVFKSRNQVMEEGSDKLLVFEECRLFLQNDLEILMRGKLADYDRGILELISTLNKLIFFGSKHFDNIWMVELKSPGLFMKAGMGLVVLIGEDLHDVVLIFCL